MKSIPLYHRTIKGKERYFLVSHEPILCEHCKEEITDFVVIVHTWIKRHSKNNNEDIFYYHSTCEQHAQNWGNQQIVAAFICDEPQYGSQPCILAKIGTKAFKGDVTEGDTISYRDPMKSRENFDGVEGPVLIGKPVEENPLEVGFDDLKQGKAIPMADDDVKGLLEGYQSAERLPDTSVKIKRIEAHDG